MGPITLFDKSFLQSLSVDESVFFDHFFYTAICPVFFVETLADLEKAVREGRTPEQEVGIIARKVPELAGMPLMYHAGLVLGNLMGKPIPMDGRIMTPGGTPVKFEGKSGVRHEVPPEAEAFSRWQKGEFLHLERLYAKAWREQLANTDLLAVAAGIKAMGIDPRTCKSLEEAKGIADAFVRNVEGVPDRIRLALVLLNIPNRREAEIIERWRANGSRPLAQHAPYAAYVLAVELFFQIALGAQLIGTSRASNRVDIAYMFYLPFCQVFVSSDTLHQRCAPLFLRQDQSFVWGLNLKTDLQRLIDYYSRLPDEQKEQGLYKMAPVPPTDLEGSLVVHLWDQHLMSVWRSRSGAAPPLDEARDAEILDHLKRFSDAPVAAPGEADFDPQDAEMVQVHRRVHKRKGSWWQLPKDLKEEAGHDPTGE